MIADVRVERRRLGGWLGGVSPPRRRDGARPAGEDAGIPTSSRDHPPAMMLWASIQSGSPGSTPTS